MTGTIQASLAAKDLPSEHLVDTACVDADWLATTRTDYDVDLYSPARRDTSWQARSGCGFDLSRFVIDGEARQVRCPVGRVSRSWKVQAGRLGQAIMDVRFGRQVCWACARRKQCTTDKTHGRTLTFRPQAQQEALEAARQRQEPPEFQERYKLRAGIEGTLSQGRRSFDPRQARYLGLSKTHLPHVFTAAAMNLTRAVSWLMDNPKASTRRSRFAMLAQAA